MNYHSLILVYESEPFILQQKKRCIFQTFPRSEIQIVNKKQGRLHP